MICFIVFWLVDFIGLKYGIKTLKILKSPILWNVEPRDWAIGTQIIKGPSGLIFKNILRLLHVFLRPLEWLETSINHFPNDVTPTSQHKRKLQVHHLESAQNLNNDTIFDALIWRETV